jgi:hypothetical protein
LSACPCIERRRPMERALCARKWAQRTRSGMRLRTHAAHTGDLHRCVPACADVGVRRRASVTQRVPCVRSSSLARPFLRVRLPHRVAGSVSG